MRRRGRAIAGGEEKDMQHNVRSAPMASAAARRQMSGNEIAAGIALIVFGALLWLAGARYTLTGWVYGLNWFAAWLGLPAQIPPPVGMAVLFAVPIGLVYSLVELYRPWKARGDWTAAALIWVIWVIIVFTDGGSTFLGVKQVAPDAWLITRQVAASDYLAGGWSLVLTFIPEWLMIGGIKLLRR